MALCPAHDDHNPSLKIWEWGGRVYLHCFAGCAEEEIWQALGFDPPWERTPSPSEEDLEAEYYYRDEQGLIIAVFQRFKGKRFTWRLPGASKPGLGGLKELPLYRLPDVLKAKERGETIYIAEGEKDVETLRALGFVATCNPNGAGKWRPWHTEALTGASEVVILPDQDPSGKTHSEAVAKALTGKVGSIRVVDLPEGKDVTEWAELLLKAGKSKDEIRTEFMRIVAETEPQGEEEHLPDPLDLIPVVEFPWEVIPASLREAWEDLAQAVSVPPEAAATLGLGVIGGLLGNRVLVSPKCGWKEHLSLWTVFVKPTGTGGTPLLKALMGPIYKKQAKAWEEYREKVEVWEKTPQKERGPRPEMRSYHTQDATTEALARILVSNPQGVLLDADELAGLFKGLGQYKSRGRGNDLEHLLSIWSGKPTKIDRVTTEPLYIPSPSLGVVGGVQPGVLTRLFQAEAFESGLAPRFLFFVTQDPPPPLSEKGWEKKEVWKALVNRLIETSWDIEAIFSQEALKELMAFDAELKRLAPYLPTKLAVFTPKAVTYAVRLAGILHVLEALEEGGEPTRVVHAETVKSAIRLARFFLGQARLVVELYGFKVQLSEHEKALIEAILEQQDKVRGGKVPLSLIRESYNKKVPEPLRLTPHGIGGALRKLFRRLGISVTIVKARYCDKANVSCLVWTPQLTYSLRRKSTLSTLSTNSPGKQIHLTSRSPREVHIVHI